ncbi:hypothetical protein [Prescottella subtropica]|uniref:hypothetical protein n=1 Tax=Prescottella subtropica TaxID=2545757 RepID=UPI0010F68D7C|nr:hypothetical protein [Prescottella subtropica]
MAIHQVGSNRMSDEQVETLRASVAEGRSPDEIANSLARIADLEPEETLFIRSVAAAIANEQPMPWELPQD